MMATFPPGQNMHPMQAGHPGMAGNPQMMGQPMQMHPGGAAPHVSQAGAMMGLQPGAVAGMQPGGLGPHPGAVPMAGRGMGMTGMPGVPSGAHLTPQQQLLQQQALQAGHANPQMMAQLQQQQQQRLLQQRLAMQQAQAMAGVGGNPQQMMSMQAMQAQAMNNMQAQAQAQAQAQGQFPGGQVQLPAHLIMQQQQLRQQQAQTVAQQQQAQQAQQVQQAQAQHQQAQQAQQAQAVAQHAAAQQQQQQQAQAAQAQQQQLAMQHANSQQSNPSQPAAAAQPSQPSQQPQPRPQSRLSTVNDAAQSAQQSGAQQAAQTAAAGPQASQAQSEQAQSTAQNAQGQAMTPQQQQIQKAKLQQMQQMQMMALRQQSANIPQAQQQANLGGQALLKLMLFADTLGSMSQADGSNLSNWHSMVDRCFANDGRLTLQLYKANRGPIEVSRATVPRYFWLYFERGALSIKLHIEGAQENAQPDGRTRVTCQRATQTVAWPNGVRAEHSGPLSALFAPHNGGLEQLEFHMAQYEELITQSEVERVVSTWSPTLSNNKSPKLSKKNPPKPQSKQQDSVLTINAFPRAPRGGAPKDGESVPGSMIDRMSLLLEISEELSMMQDLMHFAQDKSLKPSVALDHLAAEYEGKSQSGTMSMQFANAQLMNNNGQRMMKMPQGQGFMSSPHNTNMPLPMQGMNNSPHFANLNAPGMPFQGNMTSSPAQTHMAPPMLPQHSQQGTNSSTVSADTSPQVNNKRRRSTVKMEGDEGGGEKVKPSPRMGKKAKPS